jgi:hypothetical protein
LGLILLPQAVHTVFSKNWSCSQRLFSHRIISVCPHNPQWASPTKAGPPQKGQAVTSGLPQPEQTASSRPMARRQAGHW